MIIKPKQSGHQENRKHSYKSVLQPKPKDAFAIILQTDGVKSMMFEGSDVHVFVNKNMSAQVRDGLPKVAGGRPVVIFEKE